MSTWNQRFFASTRGQVVTLLRQGHATVEELARSLELTDNAVRSHLAALERDGLVVQSGVRRGAGKPAYTYQLTPEAEAFFPKAYGALLNLLLDTLAERMSPEGLVDLLRDVGRRLAMADAAPDGDLRARVERGAALIGELGGLAVVEEQEDGFAIAGRSCPLASAVAEHPATCLLAEALLTDVIGTPVCQACDPDIPRCRFEIGAVAATGHEDSDSSVA